MSKTLRLMLGEADYNDETEKAVLDQAVARPSPKAPAPAQPRRFKRQLRREGLDAIIPPAPVTEDCGECGPEDDDFVECPQCGGDGVELGSLGKLKHYRCRACGWTFSSQP